MPISTIFKIGSTKVVLLQCFSSDIFFFLGGGPFLFKNKSSAKKLKIGFYPIIFLCFFFSFLTVTMSIHFKYSNSTEMHNMKRSENPV